MGVKCDVVAPSLIPKVSGDRVKTDQGCQAAGGAAPGRRAHSIAIPDTVPKKESLDLLVGHGVNTVQDLTRALQPFLSGLRLRHSAVWRAGSPSTQRHRRRLATLSFDDPAIATTYSHDPGDSEAARHRFRQSRPTCCPGCATDPFGEQVARLAAYLGE